MAATYKGQVVTVLRPAVLGDPDFKEDGGEQVLIRMTDGSQCAVAKSDVGDSIERPSHEVDTTEKLVPPDDSEPILPIERAIRSVPKKVKKRGRR